MDDHQYFYQAYEHIASDLAKDLWFFVHAAGWFSCTPDYYMSRTSFVDFQLMYVTRGRGTVTWKGDTFPVEAHEIVLLDLNQPHQYEADKDDPWELMWVHFGGSQTPGFIRVLQCDTRPVLSVPASVKFGRWFRNLFELVRDRPVGMEPRMSSLITRILTELVALQLEHGAVPFGSEAPTWPDAVRQSIAFMEENYDQPLTLETIAGTATLSPFHFARLFKRTTGYSVMEYLMRFRLAQAKYLLSETPLSVGEIGNMVGFPDQSYFSKMFKRYERMTPSHFRQLNTHTPEGDDE